MSDDVKMTTGAVSDSVKKKKTLGTVRMYKEGTNQSILIPQPSNDANDPLNWSKAYRYYLVGLTSTTLFLATFLAVGPSVALVEVAMALFGVTLPKASDPASVTAFDNAVSKSSYFFSGNALMQGMSNLFWMPLAVRYGRRPVYIASMALYLVATIWAGLATSYESELAARLVMGWGAGSAECVCPLTISDVFFLHERGAMMSLYTVSLSAGGAAGSMVAGAISIKNDWRVIYYVGAGMLFISLSLIALTVPETAYARENETTTTTTTMVPKDDADKEEEREEYEEEELPKDDSAGFAKKEEEGEAAVGIGSETEEKKKKKKKKTWKESMALYTKPTTDESLLLIFVRPVILLVLPPVLWATLVLGVSIGFNVVLTATAADSFGSAYGFSTWKVGLVWLAFLVGSLLGLPFAGQLSDHVADVLTRRNRGVREPEMRLPTMVIGLVLIPVSMLMYGAGFEYGLHWMVPVVGLGIFGFGSVTVGNVAMVYTIDAYRPIAGEVVVTQMGFKAAFAFLLGFFVNPWIAKSGYLGCFGAMAGITFAVYAAFIPLYFGGGRRIRKAKLLGGWKVLKWVDWSENREVGE